MVRVAVEINEVKRQHEQIVRVMELQTRLVPRYVAADLAALGQLVLEVHRLVCHTERPPSASDGAADTPGAALRRSRPRRPRQTRPRGIYRVGRKSKLLILSEYVNKTEKI